MRAILIDPTTKTVTDVELERDDHCAMVHLLGCELLTCALYIATGRNDDDTDECEPDVLYVDDEGLLTNPNPLGYFRLPGLNYPGTLAGKGLIVGSDGEGGDTDALTRLDQITRAVEFVDSPSPESIEPKITFTSWD